MAGATLDNIFNVDDNKNLKKKQKEKSIIEHYIRKTTFEFSSFHVFLHLIADIRPDKTKSSYCMSYCIKT
jgi:hypothetical protein